MGKLIRLFLLVCVALVLPRISGIPGSGEVGVFAGTVAAAQSRTPRIHRGVAKALKKAETRIEAAQYDKAHEMLVALAETKLNSYERAMVLYYRAYASTEVSDYGAALHFYDEAVQLSDLPERFMQTLTTLRAQVEKLVVAAEQPPVGPDGAAPSTELDDLPIVKVPPLYPRKAFEDGIEGFVTLEYTVTEFGTVVDIVVVESDPAGVFDEAAINAASKFKYKPRMIDGKAVAVDGVRHLMAFEIGD